MKETNSFGNPVIPVYAADPDAHLIGDRYYIYATNAGFYTDRRSFENGDAKETGHGFAAWSSPDLRAWESEGPILRFSDVSWAKNLPNAWAPCVAERNGKFYFYFCADSRIGVAVSDSPTGPFLDARGEPLIAYRDDLSAIDPMVFIDDDGQAYLYWGAVPGYWLEDQIDYVRMHLSVQKLAPDMVTLIGEEMPTIFTRPSESGWHDLNHIEASHVIKRNGTYYLQWSAGSFSSADPERMYRVFYAAAKSPLGPWHFKPEIPMIAPSADLGVVGPGHHGVIQIPGTDEWWCVYHSHPGDVDRRVSIDRMAFDENGAILPVIPTHEGPASRPVALGLRLAKIGPFTSHAPIEFRVLSHEMFERVEFFAGELKLGEAVSTSETWTWDDPAPGFYKVYARGTGSSGVAALSSSVNLDVR